jgi:hypothetical protein
MIGVDKIGEIRRAFFERHLPIKEIVRTLSVSRATVRKVIRGTATEFRYERGVQPAPKLGEWVEVLTEILEKEAGLPRRERRPFRPISPEWVWWRLADYFAVKMPRQDRDRVVPETTTPRLDGGVRTSFLGPKLADSVSGRLLPMGRLAVQLS